MVAAPTALAKELLKVTAKVPRDIRDSLHSRVPALVRYPSVWGPSLVRRKSLVTISYYEVSSSCSHFSAGIGHRTNYEDPRLLVANVELPG